MMPRFNPLDVLTEFLGYRDKLALALCEMPEAMRVEALQTWERRFGATFAVLCSGISLDDARLYAGCFLDGVDNRALQIERALAAARERRA